MVSKKEAIPFAYKEKLYFVFPDGKIHEKHSGEADNPSAELIEVSKMALKSCKKD